MELVGIYLGEKRGTHYNTDKGGKRNFEYIPGPLVKKLEQHFIEHKLKKSTREALLKAIANIRYVPPTQSEGLHLIFDPEYQVMFKA